MLPELNFIDVKTFSNYLVECSTTGIVAIDKAESVIILNPAAEELLGVTAGEVLGQPLSVLLQKTGNTDSILLNTIINGEVYDHIEATVESTSGPINILAYTNLIKDEHGEVIGAYLGMRDISPQKQLEEQMFQSQKFFAIGELAAGIAHEVRNPLTSIRGFLQLFNQNISQDDPNKSYLELMMKEIERATGIISQFLLLAKPVLPIRTPVDLANLVSEVASLIEGEAVLRKVKVLTNIDNSMPDVLVDGEQITQVILNIAKNGINSMPDGGKLSIETMYEKRQNKAHIVISDTGVGIDGFTMEKIFDPFFTTRAEGTGLGLTVSYKIIENHKGKIDVQSEIGKGTTFRIVLPIN